MLVTIFIYWIIYAFFGWIVETLYTSIPKKKFQIRGFLTGPIIPIYGFGALIIIYLLSPYVESVLLVFILGVIATSTLEYITSYVMEKLFHMRWWDYSQKRFNINGRVCLLNSTLFGLLSVVLMEFIHPNVVTWVHQFSPTSLLWASVILLFITAVDTTNSIISSINIAKIEKELRIDFAGTRDKLSSEAEETIEALRSHFSGIKNYFNLSERRLLRAYPSLKERIGEHLDSLKKDKPQNNK